jgi:ABC-type Na+ efflux pump permease subunit
MLHGRRDGILGAITAGAFLVLVGSMFIIHTNLVDKIINFFNDIKLVSITNNNSVMFPAPANVALHVDVYSTVEQFSLVWGVFLVAMLVIRFGVNSSTRRKAQNISDIVFWFGAAYLIQMLLVDSSKWFEFWAMILILAGISLIFRAVYLAAAGLAHK